MSKCEKCQKVIFVSDKKNSTKNMKQERCKCSPVSVLNADSKSIPSSSTNIASVEDVTQSAPKIKKRPLLQHTILLSSMQPELWVGLTVRVQKSASNKGECETGVVLRSGNGWVQLKTEDGVIAKRAFNLEIVGNSLRSESESAQSESLENKYIKKRMSSSSNKEDTEVTEETKSVTSSDQATSSTFAVKAEPTESLSTLSSPLPSPVPTPSHPIGKSIRANRMRKLPLDDERPPIVPPVPDIHTIRTRTQNSRSGSQSTSTTIAVLTEASLADKDKAHSIRTRREMERSGSFAESETALSVTASATVASTSPAPASVSSQDTPTPSHSRPVSMNTKPAPSRRTAVTSRRGAHLPSRTGGIKPTALSSSQDKSTNISSKARRSQPVVINERVSNTNGIAIANLTSATTSNGSISGLNGFQHISNGPRINALLCEVRRNIVQKFVERHREKIKDRPDLKEWAIRINAQFIDSDHERTAARHPIPDLVCDYCGTEKWPDSVFCWNEYCVGSSLYINPSNCLDRSRDSDGSLVNESLINGSISFSTDSFMYRTASIDSACAVGNDIPLHDSPRFNMFVSSVPATTGFLTSIVSSEDMELTCMSPRRRLKRVSSNDKSDRDRVKSPTTPGQGVLRRKGSFSFTGPTDSQGLSSLSSENFLAMGRDMVNLPVVPTEAVPAVSDFLMRATCRILDQSLKMQRTVPLSSEQLEAECEYVNGLNQDKSGNVGNFALDTVDTSAMESNSYSPPTTSDSSSSSAVTATTMETQNPLIPFKSNISYSQCTSTWNRMESLPLQIVGIRQS